MSGGSAETDDCSDLLNDRRECVSFLKMVGGTVFHLLSIAFYKRILLLSGYFVRFAHFMRQVEMLALSQMSQ